MYILVIRNHQDLALQKGIHFGETLFKVFTNEIETDKDTFETITIPLTKFLILLFSIPFLR